VNADSALRTAGLSRIATREIATVVAIQVAVLTLLASRYGFHRDELYFRAAGRRLDWGYVDQPPLTPLLARLFAFGDAPFTMRIAATLAGAAITVSAALIAREFGGGRGAQVLAAGATALSAFVLALTHLLSTATVDMLMWMLVGLFMIRLLRTGDGRWWLAIGAAVGLALCNKWLVPLLVLAFGMAVLAVGPRQVLRTWWLAGAALLAALIASPVVVWQAAHGFPLLTVARGISEADGAQNRILFVPMQFLYLSPVLVPMWVAGLIALWRDRRFRAVAMTYPALCVVVLPLGGKPYYTVPLLVLLAAAGAAPTWRWARSHSAWASVAAVAGAVMSVVIALPVLPASALGPVLAVNPEQGEQVGWRELTMSVAQVWRQAGPRSVIFSRNYGQAGAVERYGPEYGLPQPYSGHMSYWDWGPPPDSADGNVVVVGTRHAIFTGCRVAVVHRAVIDNEEDGTEIAVCEPVVWSRAWPELRRFYG
jgi:4-amino-4-deoxy-L-arabinose transferase-like glycosyltransferase